MHEPALLQYLNPPSGLTFSCHAPDKSQGPEVFQVCQASAPEAVGKVLCQQCHLPVPWSQALSPGAAAVSTVVRASWVGLGGSTGFNKYS